MKKKVRKTKNIVFLREKQLANGNISLYLDIYHRGHRSYDFLKLYLKDNPRSPDERMKNKENLRLAESIRSMRESEIKHEEHGFVPPHKHDINFLDFFQKFLDEYPNKDIRIVRYCQEHFKKFIKESYLPPAKITEDLLRGFKKYLDDNLNGETPYNYFAKMKQVVRKAYKDRLLRLDPSENIRNTRNEGLKKEILTFTEIAKLAEASCSNEQIKRAFLFSLNTGLRFVDIKELKWKNINENHVIIQSQAKTKKSVYIDLNDNSRKILPPRRNVNEYIFTLPSLTGCLKVLKTWTRNAGIDKNITWHSARHSFAVNLLIQKNDIKTVSGLLGHVGLKHTEKYTRFIDELKKNAVNSLPEINITLAKYMTKIYNI